METIFPFGFPGPTAMYLSLYVATLTLHMLLMHYVLAGSAWLTWNSFAAMPKSKASNQSTIAKRLQDWLPFALGGAITAGVAPLLFVQILYQREFYTANLLLSHRWMSILPILILAFYMLYLQKTKWLNQRAAWLKPFVWTVVVSSFVFVGYSWTENHLLSLQKQELWTTFFAERKIFFARWEIPLRLSVWFTTAFSTLGATLAWQLTTDSTREADQTQESERSDLPSEWKRLRLASMTSVGLAMALSICYCLSLREETKTILTSPLALPYGLSVFAAWAAQIWIWWSMDKPNHRTRARLFGLALAVAIATGAMNVVRESIRLAEVDVAALIPRHADAANVGGAIVFLIFLLLNVAVMVWIVRQVAHHLSKKGAI